MQTTTIPITLQLSISLPEGMAIAPRVLTEADAWQYTAAPAGGGDPLSVDLSSREPVKLEIHAVVEREEAAHAAVESNATSAAVETNATKAPLDSSDKCTPLDAAFEPEKRNSDHPHASDLTPQDSDPLGSIISDQNVASTDAERRAELEEFLASIPDVLPASANIHDKDLQFLGKLLRGQLNEDIERRAAKKNGRAAKKVSASGSVDSSPRESESVKAQAEVAPDDAAHATETGHARLPQDSHLTPQASLEAANYDTRGSVLGRLFNAHERLRAEVRELREELARTQAALVTNGLRGVRTPRSAGSTPRELLATTRNVLSQDNSPKTNGASNAANGHAAHATPTPRATKEAKKKIDPFDIDIPNACDYTLDGKQLTPKQCKAAILLAGGATYTEVARNIQMERHSVHRWMRLSPAFKALYNTHLNNLQDSLEARMLAMGNNAARVMQAHVNAGSFRAASTLLKGIGVFDGKRREKTCENASELGPCDSDPPVETQPQVAVPRHTLNGHAEREKLEA